MSQENQNIKNRIEMRLGGTPVRVLRRLEGTHSRVWIVSSGSEARRFAVKEYRDASRGGEMARVEGGILSRLDPIFKPSEEFDIPRLARTLEDSTPFLVTKFEEGERLGELIRRSRWTQDVRPVYEAAARTGRWLAVFQNATDTGRTTVLDGAAWRADAERWIQKCVESGERKERFANFLYSLDAHLEAARSRALSYRVTGVHGDFAPWNVLAGSGRIWVGDFYRYSEGNPAEDAGLFIACLDELKCDLFESAARVETLKTAFLEGLGQNRAMSPLLLVLARLKATLMLYAWRLESARQNPGYRLRHARRIARLRRGLVEPKGIA